MTDVAGSVGEVDHLVSDLSAVLTDDFGYKGSYAYSDERPDAPNPFLYIDGIGYLGLPLSEFDAKRIIGCASQAPFGQGNSTVIDKEVRDTWQIDPSLVKFGNPAWEHFLRAALCRICSTLGVPDNGVDVRYELHKLFLYETGSHFHPHQDTQKSDGMFATMVVVLPSLYAGGEIHITHASTTKVLDVSRLSTASTAVLAWYSDVVHEVKPVTSGYRLVLSYNLIRAASPTLPVAASSTNVVSKLREILERWRSGDYQSLPKQNTVAHILRHAYSQSDLDKGAAALRGEDAHKVAQIRTVAEELGFKIWLSSYQRYLSGMPVTDDDYDDDEVPLATLSKSHIEEDVSILDYLVDLDGNKVLGGTVIRDFDARGVINGGHIDINCPDNSNFSPYQGNEPATVEYWYHRTALVLFHESNMDRIMIITHGMQYGLDKLASSVAEANPTTEDKKIADLLLLYYARMSVDIWRRMADYPLLWHDIDLWNKIIGNCPYPMTDIGMDRVVLACKRFGFEQVRRSYEIILRTLHPLDGKIDFIRSIKARTGNFGEREAIESWCREQIALALHNHVIRTDTNVANLLHIAREDGLELLRDFEANNQPLDPLKHFLNSLVRERDSILSTPANQFSSRIITEGIARTLLPGQIMDDLVTKCLGVLVRSPQLIFLNNGSMRFHETNNMKAMRNSEVNQIVDLVQLCVTTNHLDQCDALLRLLWNTKADPLIKLMLYDLPIIHCLRERSKELRMSLVSVPPILQFTRNVIGYYLHRMLGTKTYNPRPPPRKLDCRESCNACAPLVGFLAEVHVPRRTFSVRRKTRRHFITSLAQSSDLFTYLEVRPCVLQVMKRPEVVKSYRWEDRLQEAKSLLASVGDADVIRQVMGEQYRDVEAALEGAKAYEFMGPFPGRTEDVPWRALVLSS